MKAVLYARVSSKEQEREGFSIPSQIELLKAYSERHNFIINEQFKEAETAKSSGRDQFQKVLAYIRKHKKPLVLLVEKTDRLYRNFKDYVAIEDLITNYGLEIHLVKEGEVLSKDSTSHIKFIHGIKVLMAKNYIDNLSEEIRKGQKQKMMQGGWAWKAPYGYSMVKGELITEPKQSLFVKKAFDLYATKLYSLGSLANELFEQGYIYKPNQPVIARAGLEKMIKSKIYLGKVEVNGEVYDGKHEQLIPTDIWVAAQYALKKGKGKALNLHKQDFFYRGVLLCEECGKPYVGEHKKQGKYTYYRCSSLKSGCQQGYVNETEINKTLERILERIYFSPETKVTIRETAKQMHLTMIETSDQEKASIDKEESATNTYLRQAYQDKLDGLITADMWKELSAKFQTQLELLQDKRKRVGNASKSFYTLSERLVNLPDRLHMRWVDSDELERKKLINLFTSNFFIKGQKVRIELKMPFSAIAEKGTCQTWWSNGDILRNLIFSNEAVLLSA